MHIYNKDWGIRMNKEIEKEILKDKKNNRINKEKEKLKWQLNNKGKLKELNNLIEKEKEIKTNRDSIIIINNNNKIKQYIIKSEIVKLKITHILLNIKIHKIFT